MSLFFNSLPKLSKYFFLIYLHTKTPVALLHCVNVNIFQQAVLGTAA